MTADSVERHTLVRDILSTVAGAPRAFERFHVDYCCHGALPLDEACERVGADTSKVIAALREECARPDAEPPWSNPFENAPLEDLTTHLAVEVHSAARTQCEALESLALPLAERSDQHSTIAHEISALRRELEPHLKFEERYVFPYIVAMERTEDIPPALFHSVSDPIAKILREHESADHGLDKLRALTGGYVPAASSDDATRALYAALAAFDKALVHHMHLEGNLLFPRALELEDAVRRPHVPRARR